MRAWAFLLAGPLVWAAHFFILYGIGSVFPDDPIASYCVRLSSLDHSATVVERSNQVTRGRLEQVLAEIQDIEHIYSSSRPGMAVLTVQFDVGDMAATETAVSDIAKQEGRLDIVVANAGISRDALLLRMSEEDLDRTLAVNLKGAIACASAGSRMPINTTDQTIAGVGSRSANR